MGNCEMAGSAFVPGDDTDPAHYAHHPDILTLTKEDFHLPLTEREIFTLTRSWKTINKNMVNTGVIMFLKMFEGSAEVREMFEQFRSADNVTELTSSQALEAHALLVMNALDESFTNFDDEDYLVDMLLSTGRTHRRFEDFTASVFWAIEEPFIEAVRDTLGADRYTASIDRLYRKAIRFILSALIVGFTQAIHEGRQEGGGRGNL